VTQHLPAGLLDGERGAIARAISRVERGSADFSAALAPHLGRAHVLGITGAPGAGKSTLIEALLGELIARGRRIGVVAVDPSSPITGGAVLGDRVRMGAHGAHENVFIRSLASRGHLGGLSRCTAQVVDLLDAAGFDVVIVETVGAGQSEVEIMRVADTRIVACPPGLGDSVQAIKAGILEIADLLVVTKSDLPGAEATARDLKDMLHLRAAPAAGAWQVQVLHASAGASVAALVDAIEAHTQAAGRGRRLSARPAAPPSGDETATRVKALAAADPFLRLLGVTCTDAGARHATVSLTLAEQHLNFNGACHGGVIFTLADTAFGLAANARGKIAVGIDTHMTFQRAAHRGEVLVAHATEVSRSRRLAVYRVDVSVGGDTAHALVSSFTGTVYLTDKPHGEAPRRPRNNA
jgi:LAO/AO transport system ATPase/phenylacetic acid degradation protein PaaD